MLLLIHALAIVGVGWFIDLPIYRGRYPAPGRRKLTNGMAKALNVGEESGMKERLGFTREETPKCFWRSTQDLSGHTRANLPHGHIGVRALW